MVKALQSLGHTGEESERRRLDAFGLNKARQDEERRKLREITARNAREANHNPNAHPNANPNYGNAREANEFDDEDVMPALSDLHGEVDPDAGAAPGQSRLKMRVKLASLQQKTIQLLTPGYPLGPPLRYGPKVHKGRRWRRD